MNEGAGKPRQFRLPSLGVAAAEVRMRQSRAMQGPIGCLFLLAALSLIVTFLYLLDSRQGRMLLIGLAVLVAGGILMRSGGGIVGAWMAAIGSGIAAGAMLAMIGIAASWVYWTAAGVLVTIGIGIAASASGLSPFFLRARMLSRHSGARIGFFRPFRAKYSSQGKNLLLPLLSGYGQVYFVADQSFDEAEFDGIWSKDYEALPGTVGGHRYTNEEWQRQVLAQLGTIDIAIVDVSAPSANVIWEIKQCYDHLPSHRIIFVASAAALPRPVNLAEPDESFSQAIGEHITPILHGLAALKANPKTQPLMLVYAPGVEGQTWLAGALYQAMSRIVAIESGAAPA